MRLESDGAKRWTQQSSVTADVVGSFAAFSFLSRVSVKEKDFVEIASREIFSRNSLPIGLLFFSARSECVRKNKGKFVDNRPIDNLSYERADLKGTRLMWATSSSDYFAV